MQLADFEQTGRRASPRLVTRVADAAGAEEFGLRLAGPPKLVEEMLANATIDLAIDSQRTQDDLPRDGDQDLFLRMCAPLGPLVASSRRGATTLDSVAFGSPLFPWVPAFQMLGFRAGVCSAFTAAGV